MSASTTVVLAAAAAQRRKLIQHFVAAGATSPERAVPAESLPRPQSRMLHRLKREGVVLEVPGGQLYLNQTRATELQARRQSTALVVLAVIVLVLLAGAVWALLRSVA